MVILVKFTVLQYRFNSLQVKRDLISSMINLYQLLQELPNNLRLRILGNQRIFRKSQNCLGTQLSGQSPLQYLRFGNSQNQ